MLQVRSTHTGTHTYIHTHWHTTITLINCNEIELVMLMEFVVCFGFACVPKFLASAELGTTTEEL